MQTHPKNPIVQSIQEKIQEIGKLISLYWAPCHVEIEGNERADSLARATKNAENITYCNITRDFSSQIKAKTKNRRKDTWRTLEGNKFREITDSISPNPRTYPVPTDNGNGH